MMDRPSIEVLRAYAQVAVHNREVMEHLKTWHDKELNALPNNLTNTAVAQGRCQVLAELYRLISTAPETVSTHTGKGA